MNTLKNNKFLAPVLACAFLFGACGDDDGGSTGKNDAAVTADGGASDASTASDAATAADAATSDAGSSS